MCLLFGFMGRDISKFFWVFRLTWSLVALSGWALARGLATLCRGTPGVIGDGSLTLCVTKHLSNKFYFWFYVAGQSVWV